MDVGTHDHSSRSVPSRTRWRRPANERGITLIEVLMCLGIVSLLAMILGVQVRDKIYQANLARCKIDMRSIRRKP